jgi:L-threonylcarbamoyladenylate synthase
MKQFWPGGLTIVLRRSAAFPGSDTAGEDTVAVRVPAHRVSLALIRLAAVPIIGTSANVSGGSNALTAEDVERQLDGAVDFIIDGGTCPGGVESTVVDVTGSVPVILRKGAISEEEINTVLQKCERQVNKVAYRSRK